MTEFSKERDSSLESAGLPEERLLEMVHSVVSTMNRAVVMAREIGPHWENVVDDIRSPLVDQLADLARRLQDRIDRQNGERA